jgi:hypothetical protein
MIDVLRTEVIDVKSIRERLQELPEPYKDLALKYDAPHKANKVPFNTVPKVYFELPDIIAGMLQPQHTDEGVHFWWQVRSYLLWKLSEVSLPPIPKQEGEV